MKKAFALAATLLATASAWAGVVTWQCDMSVQIGTGNFVPGTDALYVRGYFNGWGGTNPTLTDPDNDMIYTGSFDHAGIPAPYEYKYVIHHTDINSDEWEALGNRPYDYVGDDLLLPVQFFNDVMGTPDDCDVEATFQVDMNVQILTGGFDPGAGDFVVMRGGYAPFAWDGSNDILMADAGGGIYAATVLFPGLNEATIVEYKYVINGSNWESSANRQFSGDCDNPYPTVDPVFFSDVSFDDIIDHDVTVNFHVDALPIWCWYASNDPVGAGWPYENEAFNSYGTVDFISIHGFFNGWPAWDGSIDPQYHAVPVGGYEWIVSVFFPAGSSVDQAYKYGADGLDNEAGFGADHHVLLNGDGGTGVLDVYDVFGALGSYWTTCVPVSADERPAGFALAPAYPNPFNPTTTFRFSLEESANATLAVYDLTGAKVATLVDGLTARGEHSVVFDAAQLSSGVYVATLSAEGASRSQKLVLVK